MSNDKPYTLNVEVPTESIAREEPREVHEILLTGLSDLFNRISLSLRRSNTDYSSTSTEYKSIDNIIDADFEANSACDRDDSVIYHDSDKDN